MENRNRPLYSLTVGEYIELHKSLLGELINLKPSENNTPKELLTIKEAAEFLHLSVATLYSMNCRNLIPMLKVSGKVYYRRSTLIEWLNSGERKTKAQLQRDVENSR